MSSYQVFTPCVRCGTPRLIVELSASCPFCTSRRSSSRSKVVAAALGISLTVGGLAACDRAGPFSQNTIYGGPPIEEPVNDVEPGEEPDAAPDASLNHNAEPIPAAIYGGPPVEDAPGNPPSSDMGGVNPILIPPTGEVYGGPPIEDDEPLEPAPLKEQP